MLYCASFEKGHFRGVYDLKMDFENCAQYNIILSFIIGAQLDYPQNFKPNAFSQAEIWTLKICIS